jgi:hypothetical protein
VIECEPAFKPAAAVVKRPTLPERAAEPICTPLSRNVTVPVAVPLVDGCTVAVNVTDCPNEEGFALALTAVVVMAWLTVCERTEELLPLKLASPLYDALIE